MCAKKARSVKRIVYPLPKPNVVAAKSGTPPHEMTPEAVKGLLLNPIYAGVGPFPAIVEDNQWVHACEKMIEEDGAEQFLVNLLYVLRECFGDDDDDAAKNIPT